MTEQRLSTLPRAPLDSGPVLCMNIGGTVSPNNHWRPKGFVGVLFNRHYEYVHPALPGWFAELDAAYTHCAWTSSLNERCAAFAHNAGLRRARDWPFLMAPQTCGPYRWDRLNDIAAWVDPHVPLAVVDVNMAPWVFPDKCVAVYEPVRESIPRFLRRPGPTLLLAPTVQIGLTRRIVDLLCRFARDPGADEFAVRGVRRMYPDPAMRWPYELQPGQEEPVLHRDRETA